MNIFLRTPYNYDTDKASEEHGTINDEVTMTQQNFKEECDINTIIDRFGVEHVAQDPRTMPSSEEFIEAFDFQTAQNAIVRAREAFMDQPAHVRARFDNDPAKMIAFIANKENYDEALKLGIVNKRPEPKPVEQEPEPKPAT